jgi:photosystem II stability/assembly factor-like uncharacterized protein
VLRYVRLFLVILGGIPTTIQSSWEILDLPTDRGFTDIWALDENTIFVIGHQGLWKTFDGTNWELDTVGGNIYFVDDTLGFLTGHIITTDGGHTWQKGDTVNGFLYSISFPKGQSKVGYGNGLYDVRKATDGGWHWENVSPFPDVYPDAGEEIIAEQVCFSAHPDTGYVAAKCVEELGNDDLEERFTYFKTTDGGQTWELNEEGLWIEDFVPGRFAFPENASTGYMTCAGKLLKTTNGGTTWDTVLVDINMYMADLQFPEDNQWGYVVGSNKAYRTIDGGQTWQHHEFGGDTILRHCHFVDNRLGFISGINNVELCMPYDPGFVLKTTDGLLGIAEEDWVDVVPSDIEVISSIGQQIVLCYSNRPQGFHASIYDPCGRRVDELHSNQTQGTIAWGEGKPSGVYFVQVKGQQSTRTIRIVLVK